MISSAERLVMFRADFCLYYNDQFVPRNKLKISKLLKMQTQFTTPNSQLRRKYLPSESVGKDQSYQDYLQLLKSGGLEVNPKCFPSYFKLRNGLQYPGVATKQEMKGNEVLVRIPKELVLTSFTASQRLQLQQIFREGFYHVQWAWEDRVLNTYLLYIYGKKQTENIWYHMIQHLSRDIDVIGFWPEEDLFKFKDLTVKSAAELDRQSFDQEWQQFLKVQQKYEILQEAVFTKDNYRWIFTHLTSRCFGKQLQFTSMVPFCQFFNHHAVDGHYDVEKLDKTEQEKNQQQNQQTRSITTDGSYLSQDYIQFGEFAYDQIQSKAFTWSCKERLDLSQKEKKTMSELKAHIFLILEQRLKWDDFTILMVPHLIQRSNLIENQYKAGRKTYKKALQQLKTVKSSAEFYRQKLIQQYKRWRGKDFKYQCEADKNKSIKQAQQQDSKQSQQPNIASQYCQFPLDLKKPYDNFLLLTGRRDSYQANNQVYFCYGRNSNRTLLLRYGFAIQGNKYEHVWMGFDIVNTLIHFPDTITKLQEKHLSLRRKFKLKINKLNMQLIMFFRLKSWSYYGKHSVEQLFQINDYGKEIAVLTQVRQQVQFKFKLFQGEYDLTNPNLTYHEYFVNVYHKEKVKILTQHMQFMSSLINFFKCLQQTAHLQKAKQLLTPQQKFIFRHYLRQF